MTESKEVLAIVMAWLVQNKSVIAGFAMSMGVAFLRLRSDGNKTRWERVTEAALCGLLTVTVYNGFRMFGLQHESAAIFIGGAIGCLGAQEVREMMSLFIRPFVAALSNKKGGGNGTGQ